MDCTKTQEKIPSFLRSELKESEQNEVINHLNICVACRRVYQDIRQETQESRGS